MARDQRRLAAIVSADVAGYSRLMGRDEGGTLAGLKAHRRELIDPKIAEYAGRIVKTTGDGLLLEFPSVVDAVRCAVDVQRGMAERNAGVPPDRRIDFRLGINVGDIIIDDDDIYGDGVNVAARLQALAEPGGVCVSKVVRDQVLDKLSFAFEELGARTVKNIARPIEIYRIQLAVSAGPNPTEWGWHLPGLSSIPRPARLVLAAIVVAGIAISAWLALFPWRFSPAAEPSNVVAILPFTAKGDDPEDSAVAAIVTENLMTALRGQVSQAIALVSSGVATTQRASADARSIGRELNAAFLVTGEVRRAGDRIEIAAELLDAPSARRLWDYRLTVETTALNNPKATAPSRMTASLAGAIFAANMVRFSGAPSPKAGPFELTMHGWSVWSSNNNTVAGALEARKWFDKALRRDPRYVSALSSRYNTLVYEQDLDPKTDKNSILRQMDELTFRLVNLDNTHPGPWILRADALSRQGRFEAALGAISQAERLSSRPFDSLSERAEVMLLTGRPTDAVALADQQLALDLEDQQQLGMTMLQRCRATLALGRYDESIRACERNVALDDWWLPHVYLLAAYTRTGDAARSAAERAALGKLRPGISIADVKKHYFSEDPKFVQQSEEHLIAPLRAAGIPEQ